MTLLDLLSLFIDVWKDEVWNVEGANLLVIPFINKLEQTQDNDKMLIPLLKCLKEIVRIYGNILDSSIPSIIERWLRIIGWVYESLTNPNAQEIDVEYAILSLNALTEIFKVWDKSKLKTEYNF